jgi:hypothetical protein
MAKVLRAEEEPEQTPFFNFFNRLCLNPRNKGKFEQLSGSESSKIAQTSVLGPF